jgi:hypothetical protein
MQVFYQTCYNFLMATGFNLGDKLIFQGSSANAEYSGAGSLINNILPNVYIAGGVIIFFMILFGGFTIIANAGNKDKIADGTKTITSAIIGLLVLFGSYWIIQIIQVVTGVSILN